MAFNEMMSDNDTMSASAQRIGQRAEDRAACFLTQNGLSLLARNYRCRGGEIDLICRDGDHLVFVEVRLRRHRDYGGAAASITAEKQRRLILAARHYLASHRQDDTPCRFDCLLIDGQADAPMEWLRDAFCAD